jgi:exodeoxyribonuclease V gamma subunit
VHGEDYVIVGEIDGVGDGEVVHIHVVANKGKYRLRAWICHLMASVARAHGETDLPAQSRLITKNETCVAPRLDGAEALNHLDTLVRLFRQGRNRPLPFFEKSSLEYAKTLLRGKDTAAALRAARREWLPSTNPDLPWPHDSEDPCNWLCMRGRDALADPFGEVAESIWLPALQLMPVLK